ncbi:MAG TPA: transglycosylase domain-containing protein [Rubrobacteraceae bacterium]|nr:transglycosylase domain-containing protein [Rubrobacteraceae bacterium]
MNSFFQTSKKATAKPRKGFVVRALRALFNLTIILSVTALVLVTGLYLLVVQKYEGQIHQRYPDLAQDSYVYDVNGDRIGEFTAAQSRETVGPDRLGKYLPRAVVAVEDRRFYDHFGVDLEGVARAAWIDARARKVKEGGSTITEQLMKNLFIPEEDRMEVSFWRRFSQSSLAFAYEREHSKKEILTAYLNTVYFGDGAYGAEKAAERYFHKDARQLTLSESAALAGFLHAPSTYASGDVSLAVRRRNEVLDLMRTQGLITKGEYRSARAASLKFAPPPEPEDPAYRPFLEKVRREVQQNMGADTLKEGGLRIYTTLDPDLQREAVVSAEDTLPETTDPSAAIVTVEPQNGAIRALAGQKDDFNLALDARRQPGSAFKPFVLAAAIHKGISPESTYLSQELALDFGGKSYVIDNYDFIQRGQISLYNAMAESDNTVFVRLARDIGYGNVSAMAENLGIREQVDPYPSTAIGGLAVGVSPLDMASAYATLAGGGIYREPYAVERVDRENFGKSAADYDHRVSGRRVLSGNEAAAVTQVLRGVVKSGTASRFHDLDDETGHPSAGKTGTTDDFVDAWYVGYTPRLSTAVWVGYPEGRRPMVGVHGLSEVNGETLPLDLWSEYMTQATKEDPVLDFTQPDLSDFTYVQVNN